MVVNMNPLYDFIKNLYTKENYNWLENFYDEINGIALISVLGKDDNSLEILKKVSKYIYALRNDFLLIYLHSLIPKRFRAPWIKYYKKRKEEKIDKLHIRIQKYFNYSDNEYSRIKGTVNFFIKRDFNAYYRAFGIE